MMKAIRAKFYGLCPNCGHDGLVDHGGGHKECLICGYDSARDELNSPRVWEHKEPKS